MADGKTTVLPLLTAMRQRLRERVRAADSISLTKQLGGDWSQALVCSPRSSCVSPVTETDSLQQETIMEPSKLEVTLVNVQDKIILLIY